MLNDLVNEVATELLDPNFLGRKHYSRSTYKDDCHGPLCTKAERDKAARLYAAKNPGRKAMPRTAWQILRDDFLEEVVKAFDLRSDAQAETLAS